MSRYFVKTGYVACDGWGTLYRYSAQTAPDAATACDHAKDELEDSGDASEILGAVATLVVERVS